MKERVRVSRLWRIAAGAGFALALLSTIQGVFLNIAQDRPARVLWSFALYLLPWVVWVAAFPLIYRFCERWPLEPGTVRRSWWRYVILILVAPLVHSAITTLPHAWLRGWMTHGTPLFMSFEYVYVNSAVGLILQLALILAACQAALAVARAKDRQVHASELSAQLVESDLRALRAQLEPHFLFNTLNAIAAHLRDEPQVAEEMVERLSELLRIVLRRSTQAEVPLTEELELARHYLALHELRFGGRLAVEYDVDSSALDAMVPTMLLQPIVENAIVHGVSAHSGPARIRIVAKTGEDLTLSVWNSTRNASASDRTDGPNATAFSLRHSSSPGIGLANTRAVLERHYGDAQSLTMRQLEEGTVVQIRLPLNRAGAEP